MSMSMALSSLARYGNNVSTHIKNWRPQIVVFNKLTSDGKIKYPQLLSKFFSIEKSQNNFRFCRFAERGQRSADYQNDFGGEFRWTYGAGPRGYDSDSKNGQRVRQGTGYQNYRYFSCGKFPENRAKKSKISRFRQIRQKILVLCFNRLEFRHYDQIPTAWTFPHLRRIATTPFSLVQCDMLKGSGCQIEAMITLLSLASAWTFRKCL